MRWCSGLAKRRPEDMAAATQLTRRLFVDELGFGFSSGKMKAAVSSKRLGARIAKHQKRLKALETEAEEDPAFKDQVGAAKNTLARLRAEKDSLKTPGALLQDGRQPSRQLSAAPSSMTRSSRL